jgi:hypothetical protein
LDSNQRRHCHQIYSLTRLTASVFTHQRQALGLGLPTAQVKPTNDRYLDQSTRTM